MSDRFVFDMNIHHMGMQTEFHTGSQHQLVADPLELLGVDGITVMIPAAAFFVQLAHNLSANSAAEFMLPVSMRHIQRYQTRSRHSAQAPCALGEKNRASGSSGGNGRSGPGRAASAHKNVYGAAHRNFL